MTETAQQQVKPAQEPQQLDCTINVSCDGIPVGTIALDTKHRLMRGSTKSLRRHICFKMGLSRLTADVVILFILNRYVTHDHYFDSTSFRGRVWSFVDAGWN